MNLTAKAKIHKAFMRKIQMNLYECNKEIKEYETVIEEYSPKLKEEYEPIYKKIVLLRKIDVITNKMYIIGLCFFCMWFGFLIYAWDENFNVFSVSDVLKVFSICCFYMFIVKFVGDKASKNKIRTILKNKILYLSDTDSFNELESDFYKQIDYLCNKNMVFRRKVDEVRKARENKVLFFDYEQLHTKEIFELYKVKNNLT